MAETILESGNTLLTILGDILDFSKIDHNSMELESVPLFLRDAVEATMDMAAADAHKRGIELAYSLDPRLAQRRVMGDMTRIRQVLNNLVSNAVKFTEAGDVVVDVCVDPAPASTEAALQALRTRVLPQGGDGILSGGGRSSQDGRCCLHVAVRDTGIGIAPEAMSRLFQSFRQGHESMTRRYGGTGALKPLLIVLQSQSFFSLSFPPPLSSRECRGRNK